LFGKDISPEEAARIINRGASDDKVPDHLGEDLNGDDIDDTDERIDHLGEVPNERGLPPS
jgi:hypothetical protein